MLFPHLSWRPRRDLSTRAAIVLAALAFPPGNPVAAAPAAPGESVQRNATATHVTDTLTLGDERSEQTHRLTSERSEPLRDGLGDSARRLLAPEASAPEQWQGGRMAFTMAVDPARPNYLTARFWGSEDGGGNRLLLFCEGKQVGYRHLGDIDMLDDSNGAPPCVGRFFYNTVPLPEEMTRGKSELHMEVRSTGAINGYAGQFDKYQKPMQAPSRGVYRLYTHTDPGFVPPADERQGAAPANPPVRRSPGPEVLDRLKERVNREVNARLDDRPLTQIQLWFLARAYPVKWTAAHGNPKVVKKAVDTLDALYVAFRQDPKIAQAEPSVYNADWFGVGPAASAVVTLAEPLKPFLDAPVAGGPAGVTRRAGWSEMFKACRDWHRENRRQYTNQSMINDTFGIYWANRGVAVLTPAAALPEASVRRYLHESAGLEPWLGSERNGAPTKPLGENYLQLTAKGLTKELGYVGYYGEVLDWMTTMYEATRPTPDQPGDPALKARLVKAAKARAVFRYPGLDAQGNRTMRAEAVIGWRDQGHYPADITYGQRPTWDASAIEAAAATLDPALVGYARQMIADGQFFAALETQMKDNGLRPTAGLLGVPDDYAAIMAQPPAAAAPLPMTAGQPDFVFADEEDGVVAVKHGAEIFYASLYWRARFAVNFLAKVHAITPAFERVAVVRQGTEFTPSGQTYARADWTNMGFGNGGMRYPGDLHSANAGEKLPIAKVPAGVDFKPGQESPFAGKGDFYTLRYGSYLIGMNCTADREFPLAVPAGVVSARDLATGKTVTLNGPPPKVGPKSTLVLFLSEPNASAQAQASVTGR